MKIYKQKYSGVFWRLYNKPINHKNRTLLGVMNLGTHCGKFGYYWEHFTNTYCNATPSNNCYATQKECIDNFIDYLCEE